MSEICYDGFFRDPRTGQLPAMIRFVADTHAALHPATENDDQDQDRDQDLADDHARAPAPTATPEGTASAVGPKAAVEPTSKGRAAPVHGRLDAAACRAQRVYPGPAGELISRELRAAVAFGYRIGSGGRGDRGAMLIRLAEQILATDDEPQARPIPKPATPLPGELH